MLREELDAILVFINEATLTDTEWAKVESELPESNITAKDKYQALYVMLSKRSGEGDATEKLTGYFISKGFTQIEKPKVTFNNIFIGAPLE